MDFGQGVELRTWTYWVPEGAYPDDVMRSWADEDEILDELLELAEVLACEGELKPDFDISTIGSSLEPRFVDHEGIGERRKKEAAANPPPDLYKVPIPQWSRQVADMGIRGKDERAVRALRTKYEKLMTVGDREGIRDVLRQMVRLQWSLHGGVSKESVGTCNDLATVLLEMGDYKEAEMLMRTVTEFQHGSGAAVSHVAVKNYGASLHRQGQLEDAAAMYEWGLQAAFPDLDFRDWDAGFMLEDLAMVYLEMGEPDKASAALERAKPIAAFTKNDEPSVLGKWLAIEALVAKARGDLETAEDVARRGVNYSWNAEYAYGKDVVFNLKALTEVLEAKGDTEGAERARQQAKALGEGMAKKEYLDQYGTASLE
jgi:hypothetical protein